MSDGKDQRPSRILLPASLWGTRTYLRDADDGRGYKVGGEHDSVRRDDQPNANSVPTNRKRLNGTALRFDVPYGSTRIPEHEVYSPRWACVRSGLTHDGYWKALQKDYAEASPGRVGDLLRWGVGFVWCSGWDRWNSGLCVNARPHEAWIPGGASFAARQCIRATLDVLVPGLVAICRWWEADIEAAPSPSRESFCMRAITSRARLTVSFSSSYAVERSSRTSRTWKSEGCTDVQWE